MKISWKLTGMFSTWRSRAALYMGLFNFFNIILLQPDKMLLVWEVIALCLILVVDIKKIMPNENNYVVDMTPRLSNGLKQIEDMHRILGIKDEKRNDWIKSTRKWELKKEADAMNENNKFRSIKPHGGLEQELEFSRRKDGKKFILS